MSIDFLPNSPLRLGLVKNAEAIIGMPWTPMSYAGVARRSMYREAAYSAAAANAAAMNVAAANAAAANAAAAQAAAANAAAAQASAANAAAAAAAAQQAAAALPVGTMVPSLPPGCTSTVIGAAILTVPASTTGPASRATTSCISCQPPEGAGH